MDTSLSDYPMQQLLLQQQQMKQLQGVRGWRGVPPGSAAPARTGRRATNQLRLYPVDAVVGKSKKTKKQPSGKLVFRRVDQLWDTKTHRFELKDTAEEVKATNDEGYLFNVRRTFTWEGEYRVSGYYLFELDIY